MSIKVTSKVWDHSRHSGSALLVLLAIADFADDEGMAFPGLTTLAKKARTTVRNLHKVLEKLVESGELVIDHKNGVKTRNGQRTNRYLIQLDNLLGGVREDTTSSDKVVNPSTPLSKKEVPHSSPPVVNSSTPLYRKEVSSSSPEPSVNKQPSVEMNPSEKPQPQGIGGGGLKDLDPTPEKDSFMAKEKDVAPAMTETARLLRAQGVAEAVARGYGWIEYGEALKLTENARQKAVRGELRAGRVSYLVGALKKIEERERDAYARSVAHGLFEGSFEAYVQDMAHAAQVAVKVVKSNGTGNGLLHTWPEEEFFEVCNEYSESEL